MARVRPGREGRGVTADWPWQTGRGGENPPDGSAASSAEDALLSWQTHLLHVFLAKSVLTACRLPYRYIYAAIETVNKLLCYSVGKSFKRHLKLSFAGIFHGMRFEKLISMSRKVQVRHYMKSLATGNVKRVILP